MTGDVCLVPMFLPPTPFVFPPPLFSLSSSWLAHQLHHLSSTFLPAVPRLLCLQCKIQWPLPFTTGLSSNSHRHRLHWCPQRIRQRGAFSCQLSSVSSLKRRFGNHTIKPFYNSAPKTGQLPLAKSKEKKNIKTWRWGYYFIFCENKGSYGWNLQSKTLGDK